jgi:tRNA-specific 2-thiouridylase
MTARKPDSQEICFVPDGDYAAFIRRHVGEVDSSLLPVLGERETAGPILFKDGTQLGTHRGLHRFTVGQRRGLGIAHKSPLYVLRLDLTQNALIVGYKDDVFSRELAATKVNWIPRRKPEKPIEAQVKVRSNHRAAKAEIRLEVKGQDSESLEAKVLFDEPQLAVTPGQAAVFYQGQQVLGGGWIESNRS